MKIIYLKPLSGYATPLRSDTLWGIICWGIRHLWGEGELVKFLEACNAGDPPFVISSTYPFKYPYDIRTGSYIDEPLLFFPNPLPFFEKDTDDIETALKNAFLRKQYKKRMRLVNLEDFNKIMDGSLTAEGLSNRLRMTLEEEESIKKEAERTGTLDKEREITQAEVNRTAPRNDYYSMTHNTIDRLRGGTLNLKVDGGAPGETAGQLFHSPENYWTDIFADPQKDSNTGIFFLADGPDLSKLEPLLRLFRHWGLGADRTTGKGFFEPVIKRIELAEPKPEDAKAMLNLSLFRPKIDELRLLDGLPADDPRFQYLIELREGFVGGYHAHLPKRAHRYFSEGSVFPKTDLKKGRWLGGLISQSFEKNAPSHPVYDNGFGFMVHLKNWPL